MNYPVWQLDAAGGGLLIALIAVFHVFISHFAVGGGLFLVLTEYKGLRDGSQVILDYVKKHTRFFLLLTMVLGGMSGVGIWFTIGLLNPAATSTLIHLFVFGWAVEWVFFLIEIISLFIYATTFGRMDDRTHLLMGWIYFGAAWMSLFVINGIIDFMLTPGAWIAGGGFWSAFFNPTFWPALFFRTFLALIIAGLFGLVTATWMRDQGQRLAMLRYSGMWLLAPFFLLVASAWWYRSVLPSEMVTLIFAGMPELRPVFGAFAGLSALLVLGGLLLAIRLPGAVTRPVALGMLVIGLLHIGAFEFIREGGRRPFIIRDYMYSNSILRQDLTQVQQAGVLASARWAGLRQVDEDNPLPAGRELFSLLCHSCHSLGGPFNDIIPLSSRFTPFGMEAFVTGLGRHNPYMPPFAGTAAEARALAHYLTRGLYGRQDVGVAEAAAVQPGAGGTGPVDPDAEYLLSAWSGGGGLCLSDGNDILSLGLPPLRVGAQLFRRDAVPEPLFRNIQLRCLDDRGGSVAMTSGPDAVFEAILPVAAGRAATSLQVEAVDSRGTVLARTGIVLPGSREMGCGHCHGGVAATNSGMLFSEETAGNILAAHDKVSHTKLVEAQRSGGVVRCQGCHPDGDGGNTGGALGLSAAMHGFHAAYLAGRGAAACAACHLSAGMSCMRDIHRQVGLDCTNCHGTLAEHGAGLLRGGAAVPRAGQLLARLEEWGGRSLATVRGRRPWVNQPDCLTCHVDFAQPEQRSASNTWTAEAGALYSRRADESGAMRCTTCHGSAHGLYPVASAGGEPAPRQPWQSQGNGLPLGSNLNCAVCHLFEMSDAPHHPNMERQFRNRPSL